MKTVRNLICLSLFLNSPIVAADDKGFSDDSGTKSCPGGTASSFRLRGAVEQPQTSTVDDLQQFPSSTVEVAFLAGNQGLVTKTYRGIALWDLIRDAGLVTDPNRKNDSLRKYVVVTGSDCYQVVVAMGELLPDFVGQYILLAYPHGNGNTLGSGGAVRLVVPGDKKGGRYVSNIIHIAVRTTH